MITYLITGSSGSIGGCICKYLTAENCNVIPLHRDTSNNYIVESPSISGTQDIVLLHFGAATYANSNNNIKFITQNCNQLKTLISTLNSYNKIPRVILASSTSVYNTDCILDQIAENSTLTESNIYGLSKIKSELLLETLYGTGLISSYVSLRMPGVLAPDSWKTSRNFLSVLIHDIAQNNNISLHSPSVFFNNLIDPYLIINYIRSIVLLPELQCIPLNLAAKNPTKISDLLDYITSKFAFKGEIEWLNGNHQSFTIDISRAMAHGFISQTPYQILDRFVCSHYQNHKDIPYNCVMPSGHYGPR